MTSTALMNSGCSFQFSVQKVLKSRVYFHMSGHLQIKYLRYCWSLKESCFIISNKKRAFFFFFFTYVVRGKKKNYRGASVWVSASNAISSLNLLLISAEWRILSYCRSYWQWNTLFHLIAAHINRHSIFTANPDGYIIYMYCYLLNKSNFCFPRKYNQYI